jgi:hypothetical protein
MEPEDFADAVKDTLLHADAWQGGSLGLMPSEHEGEIRAYLKGLGYLGPGGCLTRKGAEKARQVQRNAGWL